MGFVGSLVRFTGKTAVFGAKVGLFVGSVQLTSELGVWGRDPQLAKKRIQTFFGCENMTKCPIMRCEGECPVLKVLS
ncbi:Oidioi.mRNA.OKI2018_I69.XSR.g14946.t1.cds [Oikopleura dioica]|uniref:Oidioi.mRNA.OKI2018_I69.XSR.g14946.t1.cds n=1 Tax=Oikopleura dioica TaxID=34765 RepID=A0ABN7SF77_OIKDI|nr:Oidioi.mRNA.OKI2018_I69.XSR.g14946.t1.cds [Oikopleura dioica]